MPRRSPRRELVQQLRAERVDRPHLEAARRFQRAANRRRAALAARISPRRWSFGMALSNLDRRASSIAPVCRRRAWPYCGGGLGEGYAENFFGSTPLSSRLITALRQHMGFARTGIGGYQAETSGSDASICRRSTVSGMALGVLTAAPGAYELCVVVLTAGCRPFLDAREVIVVAVICRPHR